MSGRAVPVMTEAERLTNAETMRHILTVRSLLTACMVELGACALRHDWTKLRSPEVEAFTEHTPKLAGLTYGSDEYRACLAAMKPAIDHHNQSNSHHPEYYPDGVLGMDLFDLIEMLCDWKAATLRHADGDINRSLEVNAKRFEMPEALVRILANTLPTIERMADESDLAASYPHGAPA